jgi:hypothetical protein
MQQQVKPETNVALSIRHIIFILVKSPSSSENNCCLGFGMYCATPITFFGDGACVEDKEDGDGGKQFSGLLSGGQGN